MLTYESAALVLRESLVPIRDYCNREMGRLDPSEPKHEFRYRHVKSLEVTREAVRDFYLAAEAERKRYAEMCRVNRFIYHTQQRLAFYADPAPLSLAKLNQYFRPLTSSLA